MSSGLMVIMSLLPGIPMLPFLGIAGITGYGAFHIWCSREDAKVAAVQAEETASAAPPPEEPISSALQIDLILLVLGYVLLPPINEALEGRWGYQPPELQP